VISKAISDLPVYWGVCGTRYCFDIATS